MVVVYLKSGVSVQVRNAQSADTEDAFIPLGGKTGKLGLVCKGAGGKTIAEFKFEDISGYAIQDDPASRSIS
jgi:hypothetical protein